MIDRTPQPATPPARVVITDYREPPAKGKKVELTLMWGDFSRMYEVVSIKNTTWYQPKMWLTTEIVSKLCELDNWEVTMIQDDLVKTILTSLAAKLPVIPL